MQMGTVVCNGKPYSLGLCYSPDHEHNFWGKQSSYLMSLVVLHQDRTELDL